MPLVINSHNKTTFIIFLLMPLLFLASGNIYGKVTQETVNEMVLKALKSGINFIDTAPWYGQGVSEERLGVALQNVPREKYFIATKVTSRIFLDFFFLTFFWLFRLADIRSNRLMKCLIFLLTKWRSRLRIVCESCDFPTLI